jgi:transketolase
MTHGGDGAHGYLWTEDDKQKKSEIMKKYFEENPEARKEMSERLKKYYEENPEARKEISKIKKKYFEENPEAGKKHGERIRKHYEENPEERKEISERVKNYYKKNPEIKKKILDGKGRNKPFDIFTKDGIFIKTFTYQFEAIEYLKKEYNITSNIRICLVLSGKMNSSAGFVFKYK